MQHNQQKTPETDKTMRLDKWLKITRLVKTRAKAANACDERKVKVNGEVAKPAKLVRIGDEVVIRHKNSFRTFEVRGISQRSVSSEKAKDLYVEHALEVSEEAKELMALFHKSTKSQRPKYKGRPTKKARRDITKIRGY